jgi:hypothetical protein
VQNIRDHGRLQWQESAGAFIHTAPAKFLLGLDLLAMSDHSDADHRCTRN